MPMTCWSMTRSETMKVNGVCGPHHPVVREKLSTKVFDKADTDASGGLNVDEFKGLAAKGPGAERRATKDLDAAFASIDADGDGSLTKAEMGDAWKAWKAQFRTTVSMQAEAGAAPAAPAPTADDVKGSYDTGAAVSTTSTQV
jgi:EF hand